MILYYYKYKFADHLAKQKYPPDASNRYDPSRRSQLNLKYRAIFTKLRAQITLCRFIAHDNTALNITLHEFHGSTFKLIHCMLKKSCVHIKKQRDA